MSGTDFADFAARGREQKYTLHSVDFPGENVGDEPIAPASQEFKIVVGTFVQPKLWTVERTDQGFYILRIDGRAVFPREDKVYAANTRQRDYEWQLESRKDKPEVPGVVSIFETIVPVVGVRKPWVANKGEDTQVRIGSIPVIPDPPFPVGSAFRFVPYPPPN